LRNLSLLFEPAAAEHGAGGSHSANTVFVACGDGYELRLSGAAAEFAIAEQRLRLSFAGSNRAARAEAIEEQSPRIHYFLGAGPKQARAGTNMFARVRYRDIYPGVDVEFYGLRGRPEFDLVVRPGADASLIRIEIDGADRIEETAQGELIAVARGLPVQLTIPRVYQPGRRGQSIGGRFHVQKDGSIGLLIGDHDPALPLVIDPVLTFSTLVGGIYGDNAYDVAVDAQGNIYVAGVTHELGFLHTPGAVTAPPGFLSHAFVAKLNPEGTELQYAAVFGGSQDDQARAIAVDAEGNAYVTGSTFSADFPVTPNALQPAFAGGNTDVFVVKISADGSQLLYSSYLGGSRQEFAMGIANDAAGPVFIAGSTLADDFPVLPGAPQPEKTSETYDAFVVKLDLTNPALLGSTFLGGTDRDEIFDLALDPAGNAVVAGMTISRDFPVTPGVFQPVHKGITTAFVAKLNAELSEVLFASFLGGSTEDRGQAVAVDEAGDIYVGGRTLSPDFPTTPGVVQPQFVRGASFGDGFVAKVAGDGSELIYATFLGGISEEEVNGITVDGTGQATVVGGTGSPDFPLSPDALQPSIRGLDDVFVTRLNGDGSRIVYSTFLGGGRSDRALAAATNGRGDVVVAGTTVSWDFPPTEGVLQPDVRGADAGGDFLVVRLDRLFTPAFSAATVVNAASMLPGPVAPGEVITIFGELLGPRSPVSAALSDGGLVSSSAGQTRVLFNGVAAPMILASQGQTSAVVPYSVAGASSVEMQVEYVGVASDVITLAVAPASPALFTMNSQGAGPAAAFNEDFRLNTAENPAPRGSAVVLYVTGEGLTDVAADGLPAREPLPRPVRPITVTIGGRPAEVLYAGGAPGLVAGVMQVNVRVPADVAPGNAVPVVVSSGEIAGPGTATLAIR
jgi:uncharacterized protein (TIGR03437 family)